MPNVSTLWYLLALGAMSAGCSCARSHEIALDAGDDAAADVSSTDTSALEASLDAARDVGLDASLDAGPDAFYDAGPEAHYFVLGPAPFDVVVEPCAASARVTAHMTSSCDTPAPMQLSEDLAMHTITLAPQVWHEQGRTDCVSTDVTFTRDLRLELAEGAWRILGGSAPATFTIGARPAVVCPVPPDFGTIPLGSACEFDCECVAGLCMGLRGDAACGRVCAQMCEPIGWGTEVPLGFGADTVCADDPSLGFIVTPRTTSECDETTPCPSGMACSPATDALRVCTWLISLPRTPLWAYGPPCSTQRDCAVPFDCVDHGDGRRTCQIRCATRFTLCPGVSYQCTGSICLYWTD